MYLMNGAPGNQTSRNIEFRLMVRGVRSPIVILSHVPSTIELSAHGVYAEQQADQKRGRRRSLSVLMGWSGYQ